MKRLLTVPQWKLNRWDEFTGKFVTDIWEFFDRMRQEPKTYEFPALPEPQSNIAKDAVAHVIKMVGFMDGISATKVKSERRKELIDKKRAFEIKSLKELHRKYPRAGFDTWARR